MIALAAVRIALPSRRLGSPAEAPRPPRLVVLYRTARDMRRARKLLRRANRAADRGALARSLRLMQRAAA